jgi:putative (di)nucleoside polyphosphate hydrolase
VNDQSFRAGIGACITDGHKRVLVCQRVGATDGAWQMPQGGLEDLEEPEQCLWRELHEELSIEPGALTLLRTRPDWLAYELPAAYRSPKVGRGQAQKWFLLSARADMTVTPDDKEFAHWQWMSPQSLLESAVEFRRAVYGQVLESFGLLQAPDAGS